MRSARVTAAALCVLLAGCGKQAGSSSLPLEPLALGSGNGSALPSLVSDDAGRAYLSWVEPVGNGLHALKFAVFDGTTWGPSRRVAQGNDWFINFADFPTMAVLRDGTLAAHWLRKSGSATYAYNVEIAFSANGGESWTRPVVPHTDATATEHGFVSLLPWATDRLFAVWLDGRHFEGIDEEEAEQHAAMTLRYAILHGSGAVEEEGEIDARTCSCCQTAAVAVGDEVVVGYRDRSEAEIRDVSLLRYAAGKWSGPTSLHDDGWHIDGCPVNGPSLDASGNRVAATWFTGADDKPRVYLKFSEDAGLSFGEAIRIDDGQPLGRVDVVLLPDGSGLVLWMEQTKQGAEIRLRRVTSDGNAARAWTVTAASAGRDSGFPRMTLTHEHLVFAWTAIDPQGSKVLRSAGVPLKALLGGP